MPEEATDFEQRSRALRNWIAYVFRKGLPHAT